MDARAHSIASALGRHRGIRVNLDPTAKRVCTDGTTIHVPYPLDVTAEAVASWGGKIDHEAAHVRFTKIKKGGGCKESIPFLSKLPDDIKGPINALEDARVNKLLTREYPGCKTNLGASAREGYGDLCEVLPGRETQQGYDFAGCLGALAALDHEAGAASDRLYRALSDKARDAWNAGASYAQTHKDDILGAEYSDALKPHAESLLQAIRKAATGPVEPPPPPKGKGGGKGKPEGAKEGEGDGDGEGAYQSPFGDTHAGPKGKGKSTGEAGSKDGDGEPAEGKDRKDGSTKGPPKDRKESRSSAIATCDPIHNPTIKPAKDVFAGTEASSCGLTDGAIRTAAESSRAGAAIVARALASTDTEWIAPTRDRSPRINVAALPRLAAGMRVSEMYTEEARVSGASVHVHTVLDTSGSMNGGNMAKVLGCAQAMAEAINRRHGCRATVGGHCAGPSVASNVCAEYSLNTKGGLAGFIESVKVEKPLPHGATEMLALAIRRATNQMLAGHEERKIMFAMTDAGLSDNDDVGLAMSQAAAVGVECYVMVVGDDGMEMESVLRRTDSIRRSLGIPEASILAVDLANSGGSWGAGLAKIIRKGRR